MPDYLTLNLEAALKAVGDYVGADLPLSVAQEDRIGGYRFGNTPDDGTLLWQSGAIWQVEGQVLYSLTRALPVTKVLDLGTGMGCSFSHLARGIKDSGRKGTVATVDAMPDGGGLILGDLAPYLDFMGGQDDFEVVTKQADESWHVVIVDTPRAKDAGLAAPLFTECKRVLAPGGLLVVHDAAHFNVGAQVREGLRRAGVNPLVVLIMPADCGLAIWRKPGELPHEIMVEAVEEIEPEAAPKPRRKRSAKSTN